MLGHAALASSPTVSGAAPISAASITSLSRVMFVLIRLNEVSEPLKVFIVGLSQLSKVFVDLSQFIMGHRRH
jgi:hypothetical protein